MKIAKIALASTILLGATTSAAQAEICFRLSPFGDVVRVAPIIVRGEAPGGTHTLLVGNWTFSTAYSLPVVGSEDVSLNPSGTQIGLHGTKHTKFFANQSDCTLDGIPGGAATFSCDGRVAGIFNNSSSLTPISCDTVSTSAVVGKGAGE